MKPCKLFDSPCWCDIGGYFSGDCKNARAAHDKKLEREQAQSMETNGGSEWKPPSTER